MGSGKTTLGRLLARRTERDFVDLDREVAETAGHTIPEIFAGWGEGHFRELEHRALLAALDREVGCVISCGGGAILRPDNRVALLATPTLFLREDVDTLYARTRGAGRPLRSDSREGFVHRYAERLPLYEEVADMEVDGRGRSPTEVVEEVTGCLLRS